MTTRNKSVFFGLFLVVAGALLLLQQFLHFPFGGLFIALLFVAAGCVFLFYLIKRRENWWLVFPGYALVTIGIIIAFSKLLPKSEQHYGGMIFFAGLALAFLTVFLLNQTYWWAIIPAGVLTTLGAIVGLQLGGLASGGLLFLGIGVTFAVLGFMPIGRAEKWPWIPAGICLLLGLILLVSSGALVNSVLGWIWAIGLILVGGYFILRTFVKKN